MPSADYSSLYRQLEQRYPVDQWIINGVHLWPILRMQIAAALQGNISGPRRQKQTWVDKIRNAIRCLSADFKQGHSIYKKADCLLLGDMAHRCSLGPIWFSREIDSLSVYLKEKGKSCNILENSDLSFARLPRFPENSCKSIIPQMFYRKLIAFVLSRLWRPGGVKTNLSEYEDFLTELQQRYPTISFSGLSPRRIRFFTLFVRIHSRFFRKVIRKSAPETIFVVCYYNLVGMSLCHAARQEGVRIYDLQHGVAGTTGRAYGGWNKLPKAGFNTMPTGFWCWTKSDADAIRTWSAALLPGSVDVVEGGNVWASFLMSQKDRQVENEDDQAEVFFRQFQKEKKVLVTLQHDYVPEIILKAIMASQESGLRWLVRCHPVLIETAPELQKKMGVFSHVEVFQSSHMPLFSLLKHVDVHVTEWSACVEDCALLGIPSIVVSEMGESLFTRRLSDGTVLVVKDDKELLTVLGDMPGMKQSHRHVSPERLEGALSHIFS